MSEIKKLIIDTISEHIDQQNAKGLKTYGQTLDDCPVDAYDWQNEIIQELIDALQYQQKEMQKLRQEKVAAEQHGEMYRLRLIKVEEGRECYCSNPTVTTMRKDHYDALNKRVTDLTVENKRLREGGESVNRNCG